MSDLTPRRDETDPNVLDICMICDEPVYVDDDYFDSRVGLVHNKCLTDTDDGFVHGDTAEDIEDAKSDEDTD